ncbi:hypothetical protein O181_095307 [Austropuccinia psidii MF-1]|uniref:WDR5-like beta-propeller domain-containing protein n=1 Tax=Austropuccinia psidii MF-1 TaxID=1389203 RepID=A0A9Q3PCD2_9BASI|nr:hypothetical protein [Austropuccinia psidii MF-1]
MKQAQTESTEATVATEPNDHDGTKSETDRVGPSIATGSSSRPKHPHWRLTHTLKGHSRSTSSVSFSPDGTKLASSSADGTILIWTIVLGDRSGRVPYIEYMMKLARNDSCDGINDLTWSPDSRYLVSGSDDRLIHIWSLSQTTPLRKLIGHSHCVYCVKINPVGTVLVSGSFDETIKVWDFIGGKLLRTLPGHSEVVSCLDFTRDGSLIVSGSFDGLIRMWDTTSGQCLKTLVVAQETNAPVSFVSFTPNSHYLLTCTLDSTVRLWDYKTKQGTVVKSYTGHSNTKFSIPARVISIPSTDQFPGGEFMLMGSEDGKLLIWDLQSRECISKISSHQDSIIGIATHPFSPALIVTVGLEGDLTTKVFALTSPE